MDSFVYIYALCGTAWTAFAVYADYKEFREAGMEDAEFSGYGLAVNFLAWPAHLCARFLDYE